MKTAISLPDDVFANADALARRTGRSRSELYVDALREYLERHDEDQVTAMVNAVCTTLDTRLEPDLVRATGRLLAREEW